MLVEPSNYKDLIKTTLLLIKSGNLIFVMKELGGIFFIKFYG